jgi:hypothetical protein
MSTIKLKQSDIEKIVTNIVKENVVDELPMDVELDYTEPAPGKSELKLGLTDDGGYVLYKTDEGGNDVVVQKFQK